MLDDPTYQENVLDFFVFSNMSEKMGVQSCEDICMRLKMSVMQLSILIFEQM